MGGVESAAVEDVADVAIIGSASQNWDVHEVPVPSVSETEKGLSLEQD